MTICRGKRTRRPKKYPPFDEKPEYGHGTNCEIRFEKDKYYYHIWENGYTTWCYTSNTDALLKYSTFDTVEDAINHMIDNFGGTWKWKER